MVRCFCDLCENECRLNSPKFVLPIAISFDDEEPKTIIQAEVTLCNECKRKIYKSIASVIDNDKLERLRILSLMDRD